MKNRILLLMQWAMALMTVLYAGAMRAQTTVRSNRVSITIEGDYRVIRANGLPDHEPGKFPNRGNPNSIQAQNYVFKVPAHPQVAKSITPLRMQPFGVAINGVVFDPGAAEWWNNDRSSGWQYEPISGPKKLGMDQNNAHVQPTGAYHYHGLPTGLLSNVKGVKERMILIGWAADGFPIYAPWGYSDPTNAKSSIKPVKSSYRLKKGTRPNGPGGSYDGTFVADFEYVTGSGDLDECNGRLGVTPEFPEGIYHYYLTSDFPFVPRAYRGTPDASFALHGPGPGGLGFRGPRPGELPRR